MSEPVVNKSWAVVMQGQKVIKRYPASITLKAGAPVSGRVVLKKEPKVVKKFTVTKDKACVHMIREAVMLFHKGYDPQTNSVTIVARAPE